MFRGKIPPGCVMLHLELLVTRDSGTAVVRALSPCVAQPRDRGNARLAQLACCAFSVTQDICLSISLSHLQPSPSYSHLSTAQASHLLLSHLHYS